MTESPQTLWCLASNSYRPSFAEMAEAIDQAETRMRTDMFRAGCAIEPPFRKCVAMERGADILRKLAPLEARILKFLRDEEEGR